MDTLVGHQRIHTFLSNARDQKRLGSLLLFCGKEGIGKKVMAKSLARELLCESPEAEEKFDKGSHPDFHLYEPEGKLGLHSIESMREMCKEVYLYPHEAKQKVFIIDEVDRMLPVSANALLKTFEEPAENSTIIIVSAHPEKILPTILSRCQRVLFQPLSSDEIKEILKGQIDSEELEKLNDFKGGSVTEALNYLNKEDSKEYSSLIDILAGKYRGHYLHFKETLSHILETNEKEETQSSNKELTAYQKQQIKKAAEGAKSMASAYLLDRIFKYIVYWYRDLYILKSSPNSESSVYHKSYLSDLKKALEMNSDLIDIEHVMHYISQAKEGVHRAIKPETCIETLCLKLGLV